MPDSNQGTGCRVLVVTLPRFNGVAHQPDQVPTSLWVRCQQESEAVLANLSTLADTCPATVGPLVGHIPVPTGNLPLKSSCHKPLKHVCESQNYIPQMEPPQTVRYSNSMWFNLKHIKLYWWNGYIFKYTDTKEWIKLYTNEHVKKMFNIKSGKCKSKPQVTTSHLSKWLLPKRSQ